MFFREGGTLEKLRGSEKIFGGSENKLGGLEFFFGGSAWGRQWWGMWPRVPGACMGRSVRKISAFLAVPYRKNFYICVMNKLGGFFRAALALYVDGFRQMTWGRILWVVIIAKLLVMFLVLRVFFFQPAMSGMSEQEKQETVSRHLTGPVSR